MANAVYPKAKESFLSQNPSIDMDTDTIKIALLTSGYVYSAAHQFLSDLGANRVGTDQTLGTKTITGGVFDAADPTWTALSGSAVAAFAIYKDTGVAGTSPLIGYFDTVNSGLPVTPNGGNLTITLDNGASKIFAL